MAATQIPLSFRAAPIPKGFVGTPQQLATAIVERLSAVSANTISFFASGSVAPGSNVGPWLKNDQVWYVWSDGVAAYIPQVIESESLKYVASPTAPDPTKFIFWLELDGSGKAIAVKYYSGGAWKDVYEDKFSQYFTSSQTTSAIAAAVASLEAAATNYPVTARSTGSQTVSVDESFYVVNLPNDYINVDGGTVYDTSASKYVAPVNGVYQVSAVMQVDNVDADLTDITIFAKAAKNGNPSDTQVPGCFVSVASPPGSRWCPSFSGLVQMNAGDYLQLFVAIDDPLTSHTVTVGNAQMSVYLVRAT